MGKTIAVNQYCEDYDIGVMRPSKFGNPYVIGRDGDRAMVLRKFIEHLRRHPELVAASRRELRGRG